MTEEQLKGAMKKINIVLVKGITREEMAKTFFILRDEYTKIIDIATKSDDCNNEELAFLVAKYADSLIETQYELFDCKYYKQLKNNLLNKLSSSYFYEQLNQCFLAFENKLYYSCICGLLPFLERVIVEHADSPEYEWNNLEKDFKKQYKPYFKDDIEKDLAEYNIRIVVASLAQYIGFDQVEPKCLNRHWLLHGRANRLPTKADCLKLFNIIEIIVDIKAEHSQQIM